MTDHMNRPDGFDPDCSECQRLDYACAHHRPLIEEVLPAGEDVEALAEVIMSSVLVPGPLRFARHEGLVLTSSEAMRPARAILASDWLAAHDAQVAAAATKAAGERIAKAIEATRPQGRGVGNSYNAGRYDAYTSAARIARADRGGDRG